ncbi:4-hydroxy-3-methylbut-2-en-1-yl diphosphate synthase (flavodoxin) [bacterium HR19]|nr:4-hydroxy-3-methylbut-2-en-1-yl diphosphate synthase (flavodoxin) [bacterium HR19]
MNEKEIFEEVHEKIEELKNGKSLPEYFSPLRRRKTKKIKVGNVYVGGDAPISVQTMTKTPTEDVEALLKELKEIEDVGADIVRISVPDEKSVISLAKVRDKVNIPIVADIHFGPRPAILVLQDGLADCIRINPGNIKVSGLEHLEKIVELAKEKNIPIRVGVNAGSLEKPILQRYGKPTPEALCESALFNVKLIEKMGYYNMKVSLKSSSPYDTIKAYLLFSQVSDYPLHVGVTEAGTRLSGTARSAVALGILLWLGVGDTIRVSLAAPAVDEVIVGKRILESLGIREEEGKVVACPTCARTQIDVIAIAEEIEKELIMSKIKSSVAVMGCVVNGPGESYIADFGVVGGGTSAVFYVDGKPVIKSGKDTKEIIQKLKELILSQRK